MRTKTRRPPWWQLWVLVPVLGILGFLETGTPLTAVDHKLAEVGIVLLVFGLISLWLRANQAALVGEAYDEATRWTTYQKIFLSSAAGTPDGSEEGSDAPDLGVSSIRPAETDIPSVSTPPARTGRGGSSIRLPQTDLPPAR